jgi:hypothetical protein
MGVKALEKQKGKSIKVYPFFASVYPNTAISLFIDVLLQTNVSCFQKFDNVTK